MSWRTIHSHAEQKDFVTSFVLPEKYCRSRVHGALQPVNKLQILNYPLIICRGSYIICSTETHFCVLSVRLRSSMNQFWIMDFPKLENNCTLTMKRCPAAMGLP